MASVHGSCVAVAGRGVLLLGPPGSGKSDLALRLIDGGAILVADDRVDIRAVAGRLEAAPPETLAGRMEVRGLGILKIDWRPGATLALAVELLTDGRPERLPAAGEWRFADVALPSIRLRPFEASAAAKVRLALRGAAGGRGPPRPRHGKRGVTG